MILYSWRTLAFATATALAFTGPALAEGPISTAPAAGPTAPPTTNTPPPLPTTTVEADQPQPMAMGPCGPEQVKADGTLETKPHGELEAGIGTGGYRHIAGTICQPIGQSGAVAVSVSQSQMDGGRRHH